MAIGYMYVVASLKRNYKQKTKCNVPTDWTNPIYFGPCKIPIRKKINPGDYVFGLSPSGNIPRRIVFIIQIKEKIKFAEAFNRFPELRGPIGPIHVKPIDRTGSFPESSYEHILGSMHPHPQWIADLRTPDLDAFFVSHKRSGILGCWLGEMGPVVKDDILDFINKCSVHGLTGKLCNDNNNGTELNPVCHLGNKGKLYTGLHLETNNPEELVRLCISLISPEIIKPDIQNDSIEQPTTDNNGSLLHRKKCC